MKKITLTIVAAMMMLAVSPAHSMTNKEKAPAATSSTMPEAEVKVLVNRLEEIKEMDKSDMSSTEKRELRKEVRSIKENLKTNADGVYLSVGALILVVILLIILL